jgi:inositol transport system permease protein
VVKRDPIKVKHRILKFVREQNIILVLIAVIIFLSIFVPSFLNLRNLLNILKQVTVIGIIACGFTLVIINGDLDLSVGSLFSLTGVVAISLQSRGLFISVIATLCVAIVVGIINGFITTKFNISSIIVTLGMLSVLGGTALIYTGGYNLLGDPESVYSVISKGSILGLPNHIIIFVIITIIISFLLRRTVFGRNIYLIGTNKDAAKIAGIKVSRVRIAAFVISALCVAIASIVQSSRISSASPVAGVGYEFDAITVVLVGGTSFFGGKGSIYKTILGTLLIAILINGMILFDLPFAFQSVMKGSLILIAMFVSVKTMSIKRGG